MYGMLIDPSKSGLRKTLKEYEELALRYTWETGNEGAKSGPTWRVVNERLGEGKTISRASIILFLNKMVDQGVLTWREATGKGGHHKIYVGKLNEAEYIKNVLRTAIESMIEDFPKESQEVLKEYDHYLI